MTDPSSYRFTRAMMILRGVRAALLADDPDMEQDQRLLGDMLEGEGGDAMAELDQMIIAITVAESIAAETLARAVAIRARADRFDKRAARFRAGVLEAMEALGLRIRETPDATASIAAGRVNLVITDMQILPAVFIHTTTVITPSPDRNAIKAALVAGEDVPGAVLSNPQPQLRIKKS